MKKIAFAFCLLALVATGCARQQAPTPSPASSVTTQRVTIGAAPLAVEIASTGAQQELGLGNRDSLAADSGMLFDFSGSADKRPAFWMKGMRFGLDFIWIKNGKVIGTTEQVAAPLRDQTDLPEYFPPGDIDTVIEVNAGWVATHHIRTGDLLTRNH